MDDLKLRAGEKIGALHEAAKTAAGNGKSRIEDVVQHTVEIVRKIRESFSEMWHNELITESRQRIAAWSRDTVQRIKEGAPPLSPVLLYEELVALLENRVWRRSVIIFMCGCVVGGGCGLAAGLRAAARTPTGPHARALLSQPDHSVLLVEDAIAPGAGPGEVLVRVQAFSVCPEDRGVLRGRGHALRALTARNTSLTIGRGFAGVVLDVGVGVSALEMGDEVWGCVSEWAGGAAAELLTVRSSRVSRRPRALAADSAASLPWAGALALSALQRLHYAQGGCKGKRVAVMGAASGEGCALVQLLAASGAHVTAAAAAHAAQAMRARGAAECVTSLGASWLQLEQTAARVGPWDAVVACGAAGAPPARPHNTQALLKATAPRDAIVDLRPRPLISDRLPTPFAFMFAASLYTFRAFRWVLGCGWHTDWLEQPERLTEGLRALAQLVDEGQLTPLLDKVYLPQEFESALAHACSDDAVGTTVIRFP